ncbi:MAG TPA: hypothetical protein VIT92_00435 [Burkholderiaceae bacterium]
MIRKLVKLTADGYFSEIDPIAAKRYASNLKDYVDKHLCDENDEYNIRKQIKPLYEGVLNGKITSALTRDSLPLFGLQHEGLLPPGLSTVWSEFCCAVTGSPLDQVEEIVVDGEAFGYMDFEEKGDWPEVVLKREFERGQALAREFGDEMN